MNDFEKEKVKKVASEAVSLCVLLQEKLERLNFLGIHFSFDPNVVNLVKEELEDFE